jgi:NADH dehydrogenase FAD-containing subunit
MEGSLPVSILKGAEKELQKLHVDIVHNSKATVTPTPSGQTEVTLSNGRRIVADVFLPTYGLLPNTDFLPKNLLNSKGEVMVDEFLRVKSTADVWAAGDIVDIQRSGYMITGTQASHVAKNLDLVLKSKAPVPYKIPTNGTYVFSLRRCPAH